MEWIAQNAPENSQFLLLTNSDQVSPVVDAYQVWFPSLSEHHSQNTLQGLEWTMGPDFYEYSLELMNLQSCKNMTCVQNWVSENDIQVDYLLIRPKRISPELTESIIENKSLHLIYQTDGVEIYKYIR